MTTSESNIVSKITAEIETATGDERSKLIADLWTVISAAEKRAVLEAKGVVAKLEDGAKSLLTEAGTEIRKLAGEAGATI